MRCLTAKSCSVLMLIAVLCLARTEGTNAQELKLAKTLTGHEKAIRSLALHPKGEVLVSGSDDDTARFWSLKDGTETKKIEVFSIGGPRAVFSRDGNLLALGSSDQTTAQASVTIYDANSMEEKGRVNIGSSAGDLSFNRDATLLVVCGYKVLDLIDIESMKSKSLNVGDKSIARSQFLPDGKSIVVATNSTPLVEIWDVKSGKKKKQISDDFFLDLALSPDGKTLAVPLFENLKLLASESGKQLAVIKDVTSGAAVAFSPDGKFLAAGDGEGVVRLIDLKTKKVVFKTKGHEGGVMAMQFSADNRLLVSSGGDDDSTIKVWDVKAK